MRFRRTMTGIALASMLSAQLVPAVAHAENPMGYRVLSVEQAARLPNKSGALGLDIAPAQQISDSGMTFALMQVKRVQAGSTGAQAGLQRGDQIIAVNGRVFPSGTAFAAYVRSIAPGRRINIDYIPVGGGPSTTAGFEVKFVVSTGFSGLAAGADDASATMRMQPRDQAAGPKPDARAGVALPAR